MASNGAAIGDEGRDEAREHLRDHALKEAARIERLSRVREFVLGAQDGLSPDVGGAARGDALVVGLTYMGAPVVPVWPYVLLPLVAPALIASIVCTLVALFALGVAKGRIARQAWQRAGVQVMLIGSASAAVGFGIGHLVTAVTGVRRDVART